MRKHVSVLGSAQCNLGWGQSGHVPIVQIMWSSRGHLTYNKNSLSSLIWHNRHRTKCQSTKTHEWRLRTTCLVKYCIQFRMNVCVPIDTLSTSPMTVTHFLVQLISLISSLSSTRSIYHYGYKTVLFCPYLMTQVQDVTAPSCDITHRK